MHKDLTPNELASRLVRAADGVQAFLRDAARSPDSRYYAGLWFGLMASANAAQGHSLGLQVLDALADGNVALTGLEDAALQWATENKPPE